MLRQITPDNAQGLYRYFVDMSRDVPYYFPTSFERWCDSMFCDRDADGQPLSL